MNLRCDPNSLAGPVDERCLQAVQREYGFAFVPEFLSALPMLHGGVPVQPGFQTPLGASRSIGRFIPIVDDHSTLHGPFAPYPPDPSVDLRLFHSLEHILGRDSSALFFGYRVRFVPFAALVTNDIHPDALDHTNCECDFVCFDVDNSHSIVLFRGNDAGNAYNRLVDLDDELDVDYESFTEPLADSFSDFDAIF